MAERNLYPHMTAFYAAILPRLRAVARSKGYALGLHGSLATDLDLIAAPWTDNATTPEDLIEAIRDAVGGTVQPFNPMTCRCCAETGRSPCTHVDTNPSKRSHGRLAWAIHLSGASGPYLDVSVMPREVNRG